MYFQVGAHVLRTVPLLLYSVSPECVPEIKVHPRISSTSGMNDQVSRHHRPTTCRALEAVTETQTRVPGEPRVRSVEYSSPLDRTVPDDRA